MQDLNDSMHSHLRLHFNNEEASDEQVLQTLSLLLSACFFGQSVHIDDALTSVSCPILTLSMI